MTPQEQVDMIHSLERLLQATVKAYNSVRNDCFAGVIRNDFRAMDRCYQLWHAEAGKVDGFLEFGRSKS